MNYIRNKHGWMSYRHACCGVCSFGKGICQGTTHVIRVPPKVFCVCLPVSGCGRMPRLQPSFGTLSAAGLILVACHLRDSSCLLSKTPQQQQQQAAWTRTCAEIMETYTKCHEPKWCSTL